MKNFSIAYRPIVVGTICGLIMLCTWSQRTVMLTQPTWALAMFAGLASLAGFVVGGLLSWRGHGIESSVRMGGKSAVVATLVASASFALMARKLPGDFSAIRGFLIPLVCALPVILVGSMAAVLGALTCRCAEGSDENRVAPAVIEPPRYFKFCYWGLVFAAILVTVLCPFYPTPYPQAEKLADTAPFHYSTPEALKTAPAVAWELQTQRMIGNLDLGRGFALSKDERFLAGVNGAGLVIYDLESEGVQRFPQLPFPVATLAFDPMGERLFLVSDGDSRRIGVAELKSQRVVALPQPKKHAVPAGKVVWWSNKEVVFASDASSMVTLNLDSLELDPCTFTNGEKDEIWKRSSPNWPQNARWAMGPTIMLTSAELPETEGVSEWPIQSEQKLGIRDVLRPVVRVFPEINVNSNDMILGMTDGSKVLRFRNGEVDAFYFATRPVPPLHWKIPMPHGLEALMPNQAAVDGLALGELYLVLYAPLVNPLTNQTIGPDRTQPKAVLRIDRWSGNEAEAWIAADYFPFDTGDVIADIHRIANKMPPELLRFQEPHRWWIVAPSPLTDATELDKIPLITEVETRRKAALAKMEAEDKKARDAKAAAVRASVENGTPPSFQNNVVPKSEVPSLSEMMATSKASEQKQLTTLEKQVTTFVLEHHAKASRGDIYGVIKDYGKQADYFDDGSVGREFIFEKEKNYHAKFSELHEEVISPVKVRELGGGRTEATYTMANRWVRTVDRKTGSGTFSITLELEHTGILWQIVKHRTVQKN